MRLITLVMVACSFLFPSKSPLFASSYPHFEHNLTDPRQANPISSITYVGHGYNTRASWRWNSFQTTESPGETTRSVGLATEACQMVGGLTQKQRAVCAESPSLIPLMIEGINSAIAECQKVLRNRRWNCSSFDLNVVFGKKHKPQLPGTKERAMIHAIASAGVVDKVAQSCHAGNVTACGGCNTPQLQSPMSTNAAYQWGACSKDIVDSAQFAKRMLDARENNYTPLSALNLHNNDAGRETVYELAAKSCRCHGPSASCSIQTCWQTFPTLEKVGRKLLNKYDNALFAVTTRNKRSGVIKLREAVQPSKRLVNKRSSNDKDGNRAENELYYLKDSPSYCDPDPATGSPGTKGRKCNIGGRWDNCEFLCCGRGYRTEVVQKMENCNCQFKFCCYVHCEVCPKTETNYYCL